MLNDLTDRTDLFQEKKLAYVLYLYKILNVHCSFVKNSQENSTTAQHSHAVLLAQFWGFHFEHFKLFNNDCTV
ncbi:hypothetical protein T4D_4544 [Trichinella pseudospiralis]|uniref:Uncharacterized protein n=1 Tax=Trichinella pseudospiralis TaxID=6337 RepID=A0A0V1FXM5_TRIPS|nr:hypothetical protein T4D_4544 [Trichinella pseudospiralis]